jgi:hypothetical protein
MSLGSITYWQNDWPATRLHYGSALDLFRELDDEGGMTEALYNNGFLGLIERRTEVARDFYEQSLALAETTGNEEALGNAHWGLAMCAIQDRSLDTAKEHAEVAEATFKKLDNWWGVYLADWIFLRTAQLAGDLEGAHALALQSIDRFDGNANVTIYESLLSVMSDILIRLGAPEEGVRLAGASAAMKAAYGGGAPPALVDIEDPRDTARAYLSAERIAEVYEEGKMLSADEAIALARKDPRSL